MLDQTSCLMFLAPEPMHRFFSDYLDRAMLVVRRQNPGYFDSLMTLADIDTLVTSVRIPAANLNLADGDMPLPPEAYCSNGSFVDQRRVLELHRAGATIILRSVEQWCPALNRLRALAEGFFGYPAQINIYLTPPGCKSTPPHWDTHDLLILQLRGSKRWRLFAGERSLPLDHERFGVGQDKVGACMHDILLEQGDTLYLPRGIIHEPVADTYSVHVSIGLHPIRWYDVFSLALRQLAEQEGSPLRSAVPGFGTLSTEECEPPPGIMPAQVDAAMIGRAVQSLRQAVAESRAIDLEGGLMQFALGRSGACAAAEHGEET